MASSTILQITLLVVVLAVVFSIGNLIVASVEEAIPDTSSTTPMFDVSALNSVGGLIPVLVIVLVAAAVFQLLFGSFGSLTR